MKKDIQDLIRNLIKDCLKDICPEGFEIILDIPQDERFGQLSSNVGLRLAKQLKKSPLEIASSLARKIQEKLPSSELSGLIEKVQVAPPGFLNFYFSVGFLSSFVYGAVSQGKAFLRRDRAHKQKVLIEFVSANPTGCLSVAHARQAVVGDVLANILEFTGFDVTREYYLNDEGNQINILGASVGLRLKELNGEKIDFPEDYYQGDYIVDIARQVKENNINTAGLGDFAGNYILDIIKKELDDFGVKFDVWYSQKSLRLSGKIEEAFALLKEKGSLYEKEGALWFSSTNFGDDKDRVVVKSDKSMTYLAPDIAYHLDKYRRGFKLLINLWGPDHHGYINRLKASVAALGNDPKTLSIIIVQLATIFRAGKPVQMSTRKGQYITLREVLDEVGIDASRFFFIMRRVSSHLDFDLEIAKKQTPENPVYYVQYACARISSILRSAAEKQEISPDILSLLKEPEELLLMAKLWQFLCILDICCYSQDPYLITVYLQELAESFHKFYDRHRVLCEDEKLSCARLALIKAVRVVLAAGLELAGVSVPEKM
ncbi:MAG: arginine--tRNA ligase [Candidatus Omnitrophica bacterium]|jgi:arginyl-tRNA synthetase|nr:arginine--tRNA ligase [Candidatus Omnitrophota bacterium]